MQGFPKNYQIEQGFLFRRGMGGAMSEIAEVVEIGEDRQGIPHVRFFTHLMRGGYAASDSGQRTLSIDSFVARYRERIRYNAEARRVESVQ